MSIPEHWLNVQPISGIRQVVEEGLQDNRDADLMPVGYDLAGQGQLIGGQRSVGTVREQ